MPAIWAACGVQPSTSRLNSNAPTNGAMKLTTPMPRLTRQCRRRLTGSISAPARKVKTAEPRVARKVVNSVCTTRCCEPGMLPATAPTTISIRATEMPTRMLTRLASNAMAIHTAATQ